MDYFEREEQEIIDMANRGEITKKEETRWLNELYRDYEGAARESAQQAYEDEMARW